MRGGTRRVAAATLVALLACSAAACSGGDAGRAGPETGETTSPAGKAPENGRFRSDGPLGLTRASGSATPYLSGAWLGVKTQEPHWTGFGDWRGVPVDVMLGYSENTTWDSIGHAGNLTLFKSFPGTLVYGLSLLPQERGATLKEVAEGKRDEVWRKAGRGLVEQNRKRSVIRIGFEANGTWFPWGASRDKAEDYKAAFRRVATILRESGAEPIIDFDIGCGVGLTGDPDPQAPLTRLYPGDDVVDVMGCDIYDSRASGQGNPAAKGTATRGPSLQDTLAFARAHGKPLVVPEWGLDHTYGRGDQPDFIRAMYDFFDANAKDIAVEIYFNEGASDIKSALWEPELNPRSAEEYASIWRGKGKAGQGPTASGATS